jgi:hypothetical protein
LLSEFFAGEVFAVAREAGAHLIGGGKIAGLRSAAQQDTNFDLLVWIRGADILSAWKCGSRAAF